jgi:uncharacterized cupin superfamily protein
MVNGSRQVAAERGSKRTVGGGDVVTMPPP